MSSDVVNAPNVGGCQCWGHDSIIMGVVLNLQVVGQRVKASHGFAQLTLGLWACNQSVPKMMS